MKITDIKFRKYYTDGLMRAIVSITFDDALALHDVKIINSKDKMLLVMPSRKNSEGAYKDIVHPISSQFRAYIEATVFEKYYQLLEEAAEAASSGAEADAEAASGDKE